MLRTLLSQSIPGLAALILTVLSACVAMDPGATGPTATTGTTAGDVDKLLVVDCLLPGQIRKLGLQKTYLTARRPVKTTAGDCEIRGGEYVAHDRANYATALQVWLSQAQGGDAEAQTYVGEIYEKGLGLAPDYALAAQWYRKAADRNFARAQVNLGALYERGLGVPRDPAAAITLYRKASGLDDDPSAFSSTLQPAGAERQQLKQQLSANQQEVTLLRAQLQQTQEQLEDRRRRLEATQQNLEETRRELRRLQSAPPAPAATPSAGPVTRLLEQRLAEQQRELEQRQHEIAYLQQQARQRQVELQANLGTVQQQSKGRETALQQEIDSLRRQLLGYEEQLTVQKTDLEAARTRLQQAQQALAERPAATPANAPEMERLQRQLADSNNQLAEKQQQVARLENDINQRQRQIDRWQADAGKSPESSAEQTRLQAELRVAQEQATAAGTAQKALQQQTTRLTEQLANARNQLQAHQRELEATRASLQQAQTAVARSTPVAPAPNSAELTPMQQQQQELATRNAQLDSEVKRRQQQIAKLDAEVKQREQEVAKLKALAAQPSAPTLASRGGSPEPSGGEAGPAPPAVPPMNFGKYYALIIGNNRYAHFPNLETPINDAQAIAQVLQTQYGFETTVLADANRYQILSALEEFRKKLTENDNFLLYYAGHGELDRENDRGYWLPVDAESGNRANWISNVDITDILNNMTAKHVFVVADSCYSGSLARAVTTSFEGGRSDEKRLKWMKLMIGTRSRTVLTSGALKPVLDSGGGKHSIFARVLLGVLGSNRGVLEGPILYQEVSKQVKVESARLRADQDPRYAPMKFAGDLGAPFFFVRIS